GLIDTPSNTNYTALDFSIKLTADAVAEVRENNLTTKFREKLLKDSIIFPFALYPKGALWLVAANQESPWAECKGWLVNELSYGITTKIVQDKAARVRDRMSIRKTRSHRKLGALDPYIWTNELRKLVLDEGK